MKIITMVMCCLFLTMGMHGQFKKCATHDHWHEKAAQDPTMRLRMENLEELTRQWQQSGKRSQSIITIPVVVHVIYHDSIENISDAQIHSQIEILNEDFRALNADTLPLSHPFGGLVADSEIEFCLANRDPNGNSTNGITRTQTDSSHYNSDKFKFGQFGGHENWDPEHYLNVWVTDLNFELLGFATWPSELTANPELDGVAIDYRAFGNIGTAGTFPFEVNGLGRTATHEVGHWLNLRHIWGDTLCGDDMVADTPPQYSNTYGCPFFPYGANNSCGSDSNGIMFMNYMDYSSDSCMNMFSLGQANRMDAAIANARAALLNSQGCAGNVGMAENDLLYGVSIFPNPSSGLVTIQPQSDLRFPLEIYVFNTVGERILKKDYSVSSQITIDLRSVSRGLYFISIRSEGKSFTDRLLLK